jgi:hypothetical protein
LYGDVERAVVDLERAAEISPQDAAIQSDLSAAYLVRAEEKQRPDDLIRGLDVEVPGFVSGPFGIFRGSGRGLPEAASTPSRTSQPAGPLPRSLCGSSAWRWRRSWPLLEIDWQETDPERVLIGAPDQKKVQALIRLYERVTRT